MLSIPHKDGTLLFKLAFLALKRCVKNIIIFISCYTRNFLFYTHTNAHRSIRNPPADEEVNTLKDDDKEIRYEKVFEWCLP
jgi:hypothetical protein